MCGEPARERGLCPEVVLRACACRPRRNSEIYNHEAIKATQLAGVEIPSKSDSAIIGYLYQKYGNTNELWNSLDGIFACAIWDERTGSFTIARDPIGICSLYWGQGHDGSVWVASEMKALQTKCKTLESFPPVRRLGRGAGSGGDGVGLGAGGTLAWGGLPRPPLHDA